MNKFSNYLGYKGKSNISITTFFLQTYLKNLWKSYRIETNLLLFNYKKKERIIAIKTKFKSLIYFKPYFKMPIIFDESFLINILVL